MSTQENTDMAHWSASMSRRIVERVVVQADLVLRSPARLGNGDADEQTDMPLLLDAKDRRPLLQGTSLAGALRAHYRRVVGTENTALFGVSKGSDEGAQSALIVDDAYGGGKWGIEHRDGVVLDPQTRTATPGLLYDFDVWTAGTIFKVRFELLIREGQDRVALRQALGTALRGLSDGGITLGGRKSRGLGMLLLKEARVTTYDLRTPAGLLGWLREDGSAVEGLATLGHVERVADDELRVRLTMKLLDGGVLVRGNSGRDDIGADAVQLQTRDENGHDKPVIPGTSLAGALRGRALRIARTLEAADKAADALVNRLFGIMPNGANGSKIASRVRVSEALLTGVTTNYVQNRVSIDRFTGGALDTALFSEQPGLPEKSDAGTVIEFRVARTSAAERALLLFVMKDLCLGDLPIGGTISLGRGRLQAVGGEISCDGKKWKFKQHEKGRLEFDEGDAASLNVLADGAALRTALGATQSATQGATQSATQGATKGGN